MGSSTVIDFLVWLFSQLESLPKEDLIKYVKKQVALLKQTKAKCEGTVIYTSVSRNTRAV